MGIGIPGLAEAMTKLDGTEAQMKELVAGINTVIALLTEQNAILQGLDTTTSTGLASVETTIQRRI